MALTREQCINWINALRSGEYKQGKDDLYSQLTDRYCCLGVLAKINNLPTDFSLLTFEDHHTINLCLSSEEFTTAGELPRMGIEIPNNPCMSLSALNDAGGYSFSDIADLLESQYLPHLTD